jgi:hypothetical protein
MTRIDATDLAGLEAKWATYIQPTADGHLLWTGGQHFRWAGGMYRPNQVAFAIRTNGRDPQGYVRADCGTPRCVLPDHVDDAEGRARTRTQLRALLGLPAPEPTCRRGHDQTIHGDMRADGIAHCRACVTIRRTQRAAA